MANITYIRGDNDLFELGYQGESIDKTDCQTAVTPTESLAYIRDFRIKVNENVVRTKFINTATGRNVSGELKGVHDASATLKFNVAKDLTQTDAQEGYLLSIAIDGLGTDASNVYTFPATTNEFGTDYLKVFTIEAGSNQSGHIIPHHLVGCIVNQETMHLEEGQFVEWTWDIMALEDKLMTSTGFAAGSVAESTEKPFHWGDSKIQIVDAGGALVTLDGTEMFEHVINNNVTKVYDLANATSRRAPSTYVLGRRDISGSIRFKVTTQTDNGQDVWEDILGDASGDATNSETVTLKDLSCYLYIDGTYYVKYTYHDVVFGEGEDPIMGDGIKIYTLPWTAKHIVLEMKMNAGATEPTNWA